MKKWTCVFLTALLGMVFLMSGCGSQDEDDGSLKVAFISTAVDSEAAQSYAQALIERDSSITGVDCTTISLGSSQTDPAGYMAASMQLTGLVAAGDLDAIFFDIEGAAASARNDTFYALSELFTEEELAKMEGKTIDYAQVDEEGNETQERTAEVGLDVSNEEELTQILRSEQVGLYIVGNAPHLEQAKTLFLSYVTEG